jgi:O-antigen/teichoic acid export membrane protein
VPAASAPRRSLTRLVAQTFGTTLVSQAAQFIAGVVVARALGPEGKGIVTLAALLAFFGATIADGLNNAISNQIGARGWSARRVWAGGLGIFAVVAPLGTVAFATMYALHRDDLAFLAVAIAFPFVMFVQTSNALYFVGHRTDRFNTQNTTTVGVGVSAATIVAIAVFHAGVPVILAIWALGWIAAAVWAASGVPSLLRSIDETERAREDLVEETPPLRMLARLLAIFGAKASLSSTVTYLSLRIDTMIVGAYAHAGQFGIYTLAQALGEMMWLVSRSIMWAATSRIATDPLPASTALTARIVRTVLGVQFVLALGAFVCAPPLIDLVYGARFHDAGALMRILLPGTFVYSADGTLAYFISVRRGRPGLLLGLEAVSLVVCAGLTLVLLPRFGLRGAAFAHMIVYVMAFSAKAVYFSRTAHVSFVDLLIPRLDDVPARLRARLPGALAGGAAKS